MIKVLLFSVAILLLLGFGMAGAEEMAKEGTTSCDLSGEWDVISDNRKAVGTIDKDVWEITQEGNKFLGIRLIGNTWNPKGSKAIRGELEKDGFKSLQVGTFYGWVSSEGKIGANGNQIVIMTILPEGNRPIEITLTRK